MRYARAILNILFPLVLSGCVYALRPDNIPSQQKLLVRNADSANCVVRVAEMKEFPVAPDGRVSFDVPRLPRGCAVYLFGAVKIRDGKSEDLPVIDLLRDGRIVRKLSLAQIGHLPLTMDGYHVLHLEEFEPDQNDRVW